MTMKIIIILTLSIFFYTPSRTQDGAKVNKQVICEIVGRLWKGTYVFNVSQLPKRCNIFTVGVYQFDLDNDVDTKVMESDKNILRSLIEASKTVYTHIGFSGTAKWSSIFEPSDKDVFQKTRFGPLVDFLKTFKINGIIIDASIYDGIIEKFEDKMSHFVNNIKAEVKNLKVGLLIPGAYYECFLDNSLFNFPITNKVLDLYLIDLTNLNGCHKETVKSGISPVISSTPNVTTIELVTSFVTNSSMDKSKLFAVLQAFLIIPQKLLATDDSLSISTYSIYCSSNDPTNSSQWCTNPSKLSHDQGDYVKKHYSGIALQYIDTDDYDEKCACGKFPVINQIIDGWTASPLNNCPKLDNK